MKKEDLFQAMNDIPEEDISEAEQYEPAPKATIFQRLALGAGVVVIALVIGIASSISNKTQYDAGILQVQAEYPAPASPGMPLETFVSSQAQWDWWEEYKDKVNASTSLQQGMETYYTRLMESLLPSEEANTVCSPLNTYLCFGMLAEITDGNSRKQILDALGAKDIQSLRSQAKTLWEANYVDTPSLKSILANSLWISDQFHYNPETLDLLAKSYYASSFNGTPGSAEMDNALRQWTNDNTGGLLKEYADNLSLDARTMLALVSTIYYKAMWSQNFLSEETSEGTFHGTKGDTTVNMMHSDDMMGIFQSDSFVALGKNLNDSGHMTFFLPNEGIDVNSLAKDPRIYSVARYTSDENMEYALVHLSVPKFKVSAKTDLLDAMKNLGMQDILSPESASFKPLIQETEDIYLSSAEHSAVVEIDEQGVSGAAYTDLMLAGAGMPEKEIDFVLDRPFFFTITGRDGSILFAGIVRNIA